MEKRIEGDSFRDSQGTEERGFVLPVAIGVALLLLLSPASLQTVALQSHGLAAAAERARLAGTGSDRQAVAVRPLGLRGVVE